MLAPMHTLSSPSFSLCFVALVAACSGPADAPTSFTPTDGTTDTGTTDTGTVDTGTAPEPCTAFVPGGEGPLLLDGAGATDQVQRCEERLHAVVMAAGSRHELTLVSWVSDAPAHLEVRDWNGDVLGSAPDIEPGGVVPMEAQWAGEHALVVRSEDGSEADYTLAVQCIEGCDAPTTRYPIVFLHGMAGTESFFDLLDYWYQVIPTLQNAGYNVHVASVDPFQPTPVRATQWVDHLDELYGTGQARRVNLIGHSQGGLDSRYIAAKLDTDGRVQSITTVATPHLGAASADLVHGLVDGSGITKAIADAMFDALIGLYGMSSDQDIIAQTEQLTSDASAQFNIDVPDRSDVAYYSWAGVTCDLLDLVCQATTGGEIVDPLLAATHVVTSLLEGENDGLVSVESAKWGTYLGALEADHLDEVGLLPGTTAPGFDHLDFYLGEAERLADDGF